MTSRPRRVRRARRCGARRRGSRRARRTKAGRRRPASPSLARPARRRLLPRRGPPLPPRATSPRARRPSAPPGAREKRGDRACGQPRRDFGRWSRVSRFPRRRASSSRRRRRARPPPWRAATRRARLLCRPRGSGAQPPSSLRVPPRATARRVPMRLPRRTERSFRNGLSTLDSPRSLEGCCALRLCRRQRRRSRRLFLRRRARPPPWRAATRRARLLCRPRGSGAQPPSSLRVPPRATARRVPRRLPRRTERSSRRWLRVRRGVGRDGSAHPA